MDDGISDVDIDDKITGEVVDGFTFIFINLVFVDREDIFDKVIFGYSVVSKRFMIIEIDII